MKNLFVISALMFGLIGTVDAAQSKAEAEVETAFAKYFQARKDQDYKTVVAMESKTGTLNTNSDGSFHKPMNKQSEASWQASGLGGNLSVFHPDFTWNVHGCHVNDVDHCSHLFSIGGDTWV